MTRPDGHRVHTHALAYKAYEIEELADVYFFRPLGARVARAADAAGLSPTQVTLVGAAVGVVAGLLLYDGRLGLLDAVGGPAALVTLQAGTPAVGSAARYGRIVEEHAMLRRLEIQPGADDGSHDPELSAVIHAHRRNPTGEGDDAKSGI